MPTHPTSTCGWTLGRTIVPPSNRSSKPHWRPGGFARAGIVPRRADGNPDLPPNNWQIVCGGPAWSRAAPRAETVTDWHFHLFPRPAGLELGPHWNWRNPAVGNYFEGALCFGSTRASTDSALTSRMPCSRRKACRTPQRPPRRRWTAPQRAGPRPGGSPRDSPQEALRRQQLRATTRVGGHGQPRARPRPSLHPRRRDGQSAQLRVLPRRWDVMAWAAVGSTLESGGVANGSIPTWTLKTMTSFARCRASVAVSWVPGVRGRRCWRCSDFPPSPTCIRLRLGLPEVDALRSAGDPLLCERLPGFFVAVIGDSAV